MDGQSLIKLDIFTTTEGLNPLEAALTEFGQPSFVVVDHTDFDNLLEGKYGAWDYFDASLWELSSAETSITLYLLDDEEGHKSLVEIKQMLKDLKAADSAGAYGRLECTDTTIVSEDWEANWREENKAFAVGEALMIVPPWDESTYEGKTVLRIEPGQAFGTGTDETTRLSLVALEQILSHGADFSSRPAPDPSGEQGDCKKTQAASGFEPESGRRLADGVTVLDVGCGSGILAVAAILLGAKFAFGTDIDLKAVETAIENAALNNVSEKTKFIAGDLAGHTTQAYDIVCANISADTIIKFLPEAPKLLKSEGSLILSGIIKDRTQDVLDAVSLAGLEVKQQTEENGWVCMVAHYKRIKSYAQARSKHRR